MFWDSVRQFVLSVFMFVAITILICVVVHNVLKMGEISSKYSGEYKNLLAVSETKLMNVYVTGSGDKTVVILPDFGSQSPIIQYKAITDKLKDNYRVVVIEYYGYGFSMSAETERTNENIIAEIKKAMEKSNIYDKLILIPHGTSNVYAMYYQEKYPEDIEAIISIDGTYPCEINEEYLVNKVNDLKNNTVLTSIIELTGIFRVLSYVKPETFNIDKMQSNISYEYEDISIYRNRIGSNHLTSSMVKEIRNLKTNMEEIKDYKYPGYLPVLNILSTETVKEYMEYKENGDTKKDLKLLIYDVITNSNTQKIVEVQGNHLIQLTNSDEVNSQINSFINSYLR